jgi:5-(carboxyamino)imidazole ribonucleotide synthase
MLSKAAKKLEIPLRTLSLPDAWNWLPEADPAKHLVTFEQEHVDEKLLEALRAKNVPAFPSWDSFDVLKSKRSQKQFLRESKIPTSPFLPCSPWTEACDAFVREHGGAVLKAGRGGYDGKGVWVLGPDARTAAGEAAREVAARIQQPYLEQRVAFTEEIAAVVCRSRAGEIETYPTVRSIQVEGICYQVEYTREFAASALARRAGEIAGTIAQALDYVGVLAVEFFVARVASDAAGAEELLVNEVAPRVHNSGHFTIDVCDGSQFENHLRAGLDLPLARTEPTHPAAVMTNLLWPPQEKEFAPLFAKLTCGPAWPENVKLHWYGKSEIRPRRKMGHFTVYGGTLRECRETALQILATRWVQG